MTTGIEPRTVPEQVPVGATVVPRPPAHPGRTAAILVATWFFLASITPSLIPRGWLMQGVASGLSAAYGYGLGLVIAWCWRKVRDALGIRITMAPVPARWLRRAGWTALAVVVALVWLRSLHWQRDTARLVGKSPPGPLTLLLGLAATVLVFVLVILAARGLRALTRRGSKLGQRFFHPWVATALAALLVATVVLVLSNSLIYRRAMGYAADKAAVRLTRIDGSKIGGAVRLLIWWSSASTSCAIDARSCPFWNGSRSACQLHRASSAADSGRRRAVSSST